MKTEEKKILLEDIHPQLAIQETKILFIDSHQ